MIYLASPYSHDNPAICEYRVRVVCRVAARLMRAGHRVFSPIAHSHSIAQAGDLPTDWSYWEAYDREMMDACEELWIVTVDGWGRSVGVAAEFAYMTAARKPVTHIQPTYDELIEDVRPASDKPNEQRRVNRLRKAVRHNKILNIKHIRKEGCP